MKDVKYDCDRPVLSGLGKHLVRLNIVSNRKLDLVHLLPCIQLEELILCDDGGLKLSRPLLEIETER